MGLPNHSDLILSEQNMSKIQERSQPTTSEEVNLINEEEERSQEKQKDFPKEGVTQCDGVCVSWLKIIKMPSFEEGKEEEQCTTPKSKDHKIRAIFPPTPKKPKTLPSTKRKCYDDKRVIILDCSKEIEALFPPSFLAELGGKIKKGRASFA
ncbi:hypothetical protein LIER_37521 [Lithospermum erythrorhizon]|uniref:Uncharacterized protein n=1 Tax=Lithospermum erythrorhizon TaxID=34254 RepID=A0AAV3PQV1_LITER